LNKTLSQNLIQGKILSGAVLNLSKRLNKTDLLENEVARYMGLSVAKLRVLYGHLYELSPKGFILYIGDISSRGKSQNELQNLFLKRQLEWGVSSMPSVKIGQLGIYGASEKEIATCLGYSINDFRERYGWLYTPAPNGIRFIQRSESINEKIRRRNKNSRTTKSISKLPRDRSDFKQLKQLSCPHCRRNFQYMRFVGPHIQSRHHLSLGRSILSQAEESNGQGTIFCSYCCKTGSANQILIHLKSCQIFNSLKSRK
jgi:hypothetical protein